MSVSNSIPTQHSSSSGLQMNHFGNGPEDSEQQWSPNTTDEHGEPKPLQWTTVPPQNMVPVSHNGTSASYNAPKFSHPGITTPIDLNNPNSFNPSNAQMVNGYIANNQRVVYQPNGSGIILPYTQNSMIHGRTWMNPVPSTSQQVPRGPSLPVGRTSLPKKPKRIRTAFTSQQMMELEEEYARTRYLDRSRRIELAKIMNINERTIKIWFQNRRMKEKKERAEILVDSEEPVGSSPETVPMPIIMTQQDYPTPVADAMFKQDGMYIDHYPETSTPIPPSTLLPSANMASHMINGYPIYEYPHDQYLAFEYRQMQLQEAQMYGIEMQEMTPQFREEPPQFEEQAPEPGMDVHSTDISWIRDIYPEEEP